MKKHIESMKVHIESPKCPFCGGRVEMTRGVLDSSSYLFKCQNIHCGAIMSFVNYETIYKPERAIEYFVKRFKGGE